MFSQENPGSSTLQYYCTKGEAKSFQKTFQNLMCDHRTRSEKANDISPSEGMKTPTQSGLSQF